MCYNKKKGENKMAFIQEKSIIVEYQSGQGYNKKTYQDGIGINRTNVDYFSVVESARIKKEIGNDNYRKLYNTLKPLHLSSEEGVPMHAVDNGYHYIQCIKNEKQNDSNFNAITVAAHFRIDEESAKDLIKNTNSKDDMIEYVESQKERWKKEADKALSVVKEIKLNVKQNLNKTNKQRI